MLNKLFGPKWKHKNPSVRKHALEAMNPGRPENQDVFAQAIKVENDAGIRRLIVGRLLDLDLLQELIGFDEALKADAGKRLRSLLAGKTMPLVPVETRLTKLPQLEHKELLEYLVKEAEEEEIRSYALDRVERQSLLGDLALNDPEQEIRLKALARITQLSTLERVCKNSRRKDKKVSAQAQARLDEIKAREERPKRLTAEARQRCADLEALISHGSKTGQWLSMHKQVEQLHLGWDNIHKEWQPYDGDFDLGLSKKFQGLSDQFERQCIEEQQQQKQARELEEKTQPFKAQQRRLCEALGEKIEQLEQMESVTAELRRECEQFLQTSTDSWQQADAVMRSQSQATENQATENQATEIQATENQGTESQSSKNQSSVDEELYQNFEHSTKNLRSFIRDMDVYLTLQRQLEQIEEKVAQLKTKPSIKENELAALEKKCKAFARPKLFHELSSTEERLKNGFTELRQLMLEQKQKLTQNIALFKEQVKQLEQLLKDGQSKKAVLVSNKARKTLSAFSGEQRQALQQERLMSRYNAALSELQELQSWRSWSNAPVKKSIYERMCALEGEVAQQANEPEFNWAEVAERVREARAEWKALSKAEPSDFKELWEMFDQVCNRVYEPCQAYFDTVAGERKENLVRREKVCQDLEAYWDTLSHKPLDLVDWKKLDEIIKVAQQEWANLGFVDRKDKSAINQRFRKVLNTLREFSKAEKQRHTDEKMGLIQSAEKVADELLQGSISMKDGTDAIKNLQKQWKRIGLALKDGDLWRQFRVHCDSVFTQRDKQRELKEQEIHALVENKEALCTELDALLQSSERDPSVVREQFKGLQKKWKDVTPLPPKLQQNVDLRNRYTELCAGIKQHLHDLQQQQMQQQQLMETAMLELCWQAEQSLFDRLDGSLQAEQYSQVVSDYERQWQSIAASKTHLAEQLQKRLQNVTESLNTPEAMQLLRDKLSEQESQRIETKKNLCMKMEILAGVDSPEEVRRERMEYQVAQLADKMKQGDQSNTQQQVRDTLELWHTSGLVDPQKGRVLEDRFYNAYKTLKLDRKC